MKHLFKLLKRDWPYLTLLFGIFLLSVAFGRKLPEIAPDAARNLEKQTMAHFAQIAKMMKGSQVSMQIMVIWMNNMVASVAAIISGALLIPLLPVVFLIGNGVIIGLIQRFTETQGFDAVRFYLALLPHGIFEIPAFIIAIYLGARFSLIPYRLLWKYLKTKRYYPFLKAYLHDFKYYALLCIALLFIAAIIEMTVSPMLVGMK